MKFFLQTACSAFLLLAASLVAQPHELSGEEIVKSLVRMNLERAKNLASYEDTRDYKIRYEGFPSSRAAEMVVDVKYKAPATKIFTVRSSSGSKFLVDRVLTRLMDSEKEALTPENQSKVALNEDNYTFTLLGHEKTPTGSHYILSVEPKTKEKLLYRGKIWVDATDFAVTRIEAEPAKNPSFWTKEIKIEHTYAKWGNFWLPKSNSSITSTRLGGHAYLTIDYRDYKVTALH
jgi:outer membrane lipoprotein-sorting protein